MATVEHDDFLVHPNKVRSGFGGLEMYKTESASKLHNIFQKTTSVTLWTYTRTMHLGKEKNGKPQTILGHGGLGTFARLEDGNKTLDEMKFCFWLFGVIKMEILQMILI